MGPIEKLLRDAYRKIEKPENWCQFCYAKNSKGEPVGENSPEACQWCLAGSMCAQFENAIVPATHVEVFNILRSFTCQSAHLWNDWSGRTHAQVLELLNKAASVAQERGI